MIFLYILVGLIVLFIVLALVAPKKYEVNNNIEISCPTEEVFQYLKFLKNQDNWSPWKKKDPNMKQNIGVLRDTEAIGLHYNLKVNLLVKI